jgi:hypothetical protein
LAPAGLCCPCPHRYYDPIRQSRQLPPTSQRSWLYRGSLPDDLVWAVTETFPDLKQRSFHTCHHPYAGRRDGCLSPGLPHLQRPSPIVQWVGSSNVPTPISVGRRSRRCKVRLMLRPAWLLAFLDRSDRTPSVSRRRRLRPSFPQRRSLAFRVGYNYTASLERYGDRTCTGWIVAVTGCAHDHRRFQR